MPIHCRNCTCFIYGRTEFFSTATQFFCQLICLIERKFCMYQRNPCTRSIATAICCICQLCELLQKNTRTFQPNRAFCYKADIIPCKNNRTNRKYPVLLLLKLSAYYRYCFIKCRFKVSLDTFAEFSQRSTAFLPCACIIFINTFHSFAHCIPVNMNNGNKIFVSC